MCLFPTPLTLLWLGQMKLDAWKQKCVQSDSREAVYVCICICVCVCVCVCPQPPTSVAATILSLGLQGDPTSPS